MTILYYLSIRKRRIDWGSFFLASTLVMVLAVVVATGRTGNFQPWYLLYIITFASLVAGRYYVFIPSSIISIFGLLVYIPYLYNGNYDKPTQDMTNALIYLAIIVSVAVTVVWSGRRRVLHNTVKEL